jgi:transcriptional regulator with XRE-family HTH domain
MSYQDETIPSKIVKMRRQELSLSQEALTSAIGYKNTNFWSMVENGQSEVPLEKAEEIAAVLKMDVRWFAEQVLRFRLPKMANTLLGPRAQT